MADTVENLILEHLKRLETMLARMERKLDVFSSKQTGTHAALKERLERIGRQTELNN